MKRFLLSITALLLFALCALAQTQPAPAQLAWPPPSEPMILMLLPSGGISYAKLDTTVVYDSTTQTIKARPAAAPVLTFTQELLTAVSGVWSVPAGCSKIGIFKNGIMQHPVDYTQTGSTIAWLPVALPASGDLISITCARLSP